MPGDVMTLGIDGLGEQRQLVVPFKLSLQRWSPPDLLYNI